MSRKLIAGLLLLACGYNNDDHLHSLPVLLLSNGSMVGYLKRLLASKTMESLQVYSGSTDVFLFCFSRRGTTHRRLDAHNK